MKKYPTENGIAIPITEIWLPESRYDWDNPRRTNNHHAHYSSRKFGRLAVTQCLRDLERHQYVMPVDVHSWLHDTYAPMDLPSEDQAAREIINAYENGEQFKRYDNYLRAYRYDDIPPELVDTFVAKYGLCRVFPTAGWYDKSKHLRGQEDISLTWKG